MSSVIEPGIVKGPRSRTGTPTWEIAHLYPPQGRWTEDAYLALETNHLIEFKDGCLEFLPMPDLSHQSIARFLFRLLDAYVQSSDRGEAFFAPLRTRTIRKFIREPDVVYADHSRIRTRKGPLLKADLVMEVVSGGAKNRARDLAEKRSEYAAAGIAEYWIVDPERKTITVLTLQRRKYRVHGKYRVGETAESVLLPGFRVNVKACFKSGE